MIDIYTKLCMAIGKNQQDNNELYEAKKEENWKLEAIREYATTHSKDKDIVKKCVEMALAFGLTKGYTDNDFWKSKIEDINVGLNKDKKAKEATKVVQQASYDYGCGSSHSYGCGSSRSSRSYDYGCGGSRSSRYGC